MDHLAGVVDARTGNRIRADSNGTNEDEYNDAFRGGYGFFDAVRCFSFPDSRLETDEIELNRVRCKKFWMCKEKMGREVELRLELELIR